MKKLLLIVLLALPLTSQAITHATPNKLPKPWNHIKELSFQRYGDHLFGYANAFVAGNGKKFIEIRFSNGTKTKYSFGVNIKCTNESGAIQEIFYERTAGHTAGMGSAVEKSGEFDMEGCTKGSVQFGWAIAKKDIISLDDVISVTTWIALNEIFYDIEWN